MVSNYDACMEASRLGWFISSGNGDELVAKNPTKEDELWFFSEGVWKNKDGEERELIPPCEHLPLED